jgi:fatty-acid desaturase
LTAIPYYVFLEHNQLQLQAALAFILFATGGWSWIVWGIFVRSVVVYHITWLVNSASHATGYRTYRTADRSTNCWWLALLGWGEGWHNNHHAFPSSARHGLRWYELDVTWITIRILAFAQLARDIKLPTPEMRRRLRLTPPS